MTRPRADRPIYSLAVVFSSILRPASTAFAVSPVNCLSFWAQAVSPASSNWPDSFPSLRPRGIQWLFSQSFCISSGRNSEDLPAVGRWCRTRPNFLLSALSTSEKDRSL